MEAVLQRPRVYFHSNVFDQAKDFFTNVFKRRQLKSKVRVDSKVVNNTKARIISVEQTINALSSIFSLESIVELYEQRIQNTNKIIEELKEKIKTCGEKEKAMLQSELDHYIENLKVDSYILASKKEELNEENKTTIEPPEQTPAPQPEESPEPPKQPESNEHPQKDNQDENIEDSEEYTELYSSIKSLFEDKINLSSARIERINNITNFINEINPSSDDLQGKLAYISYFNISFISNYEKEIRVDEQLNEKIKKIYEIKPNFNINEEFGELTRKIAILSEEMTHNYEKNILDKMNNLEQIIYHKSFPEQQVIRGLLKEFEKSLNNLKYNINEPDKTKITTEEAPLETDENITSELTAVSVDDIKTDELTSDEEATEEPVILEDIQDEIIIPEQTPLQSEEIDDIIEQQTPQIVEITKPVPKKKSAAEELKEKLLAELSKQYNKINSINDIMSNPLNMTCEATIYFEEIASNTAKKIRDLRANLRTMSNVLSFELKDEEVFPNQLEDFINLHKEKIYRANDELKALQETRDKEEKQLKRIDILNNYLTAEKEIIERRLVFEKKKNSELDVLAYLSDLNEDKKLEPVQPLITQQHVEQPKIRVIKPQKINRERAHIDNLSPYTVERLKDSIKIIINNQARQELKKTLGDIKVIINNREGLKGVNVSMGKTKDGDIVEEISNLDKLNNLKVVIENNGEEVSTEEIISNRFSK